MLPSLRVVLALVMQVPGAVPAPSTGLALQGEEAERFLSTATVIDIKHFETRGITKPRRATLSDGEQTLRAVFKDVDEQLMREKDNQGRVIIGLRDSYKHEIAAYELDKLLGLGIVPPCVERQIGNRNGALCMWVEDAMTEATRRNIKKIDPPDPQRWNNQMYLIRLFNQLTWDTDYNNIANLLIDGDWKLYKIDSSRAFRNDKELRRTESLQRFSRKVLDALQALDREEVETGLRPWLSKKQIKGLLARRDAIVALADRLIAERGEAAVLFE